MLVRASACGLLSSDTAAQAQLRFLESWFFKGLFYIL
jgi:hypothetical protein